MPNNPTVRAAGLAEDRKIELYFYSLPVNEGMTTDHVGGLEGYLREVGNSMPDKLIAEARTRGATLDRRQKTFNIKRRVRTVNYPTGEGKPSLGIKEYQLYTSGIFDMSRCIEEFRDEGFHVHPHTPGCSKFPKPGNIELWDMPW